MQSIIFFIYLLVAGFFAIGFFNALPKLSDYDGINYLYHCLETAGLFAWIIVWTGIAFDSIKKNSIESMETFKGILYLLILCAVIILIVWGVASPFLIWYLYEQIGRPDTWAKISSYLFVATPWVILIIMIISAAIYTNIKLKWPAIKKNIFGINYKEKDPES